MKFKAKIDWWIHGLLFLEAVFAIYFVYLTITAWSWVNAICAVTLIGVFALLTLPIYRHTYYLVEGNSLTIFSGYYQRSIGIQHITRIETIVGKINASTLSNHQLQLTVHIGSSKRTHADFVAPSNKKAFISALTAVNPDISVTRAWSDEE